MRIYFLGTGAGTEPVSGFRHTSLAISSGDKLFWFDAGENCSYAAHLIGLDLLSTRAIFLSHAHMDHIGGLPNLLWNIRKINSLPGKGSPFNGKAIDIFAPDLRLMPAIRQLLSCTEGGFSIKFAVKETPLEDARAFDEDGFKVFARHNRHLGQHEGRWQSFSFRIECEGSAVVYSGDLAELGEIDPLLPGAALALIETGHHSPEGVCRHFMGLDDFSGKIGFIHHGRAIIEDFEGELSQARALLGDRVFFAKDGDSLHL